MRTPRGCRFQVVLCIQVMRGRFYGIRGIIDGITVFVFIWPDHRVGVATRLVQIDRETAAGTYFGP
jgi:hypothetical protein